MARIRYFSLVFWTVVLASAGTVRATADEGAFARLELALAQSVAADDAYVIGHNAMDAGMPASHVAFALGRANGREGEARYVEAMDRFSGSAAETDDASAVLREAFDYGETATAVLTEVNGLSSVDAGGTGAARGGINE